ncbi:MAG: hypothetical protein K0R84_657 [Clostridia bacterium]|jgi:hypothetical protein|nr:hypothetical protein [Clostridia bacterium]
MDKNKVKRDISPLDKGEQDMTTAVIKENKIDTLKSKLDLITKKSTLLCGDDNMIELNPNNPQHKEWFEEDKFKGK